MQNPYTGDKPPIIDNSTRISLGTVIVLVGCAITVTASFVSAQIAINRLEIAVTKLTKDQGDMRLDIAELRGSGGVKKKARKAKEEDHE